MYVGTVGCVRRKYAITDLLKEQLHEPEERCICKCLVVCSEDAGFESWQEQY